MNFAALAIHSAYATTENVIRWRAPHCIRHNRFTQYNDLFKVSEKASAEKIMSEREQRE